MNSKDKLLQALIAQNPPPIPFTDATISISDPAPADGGDWNTKVTVSSVAYGGYLGSVDVYYKRVDLSELGTDIGLESEFPFTVESLLAALNEARASWVSPDELETVVLPDQTTCVVHSVSLTAKPSAYGWKGTNTISILIGIPAEADLLHHLLHVIMPADGYF